VDYVLGLPTAAHGAIAAGNHRVSRFSHMALPRMLGVYFDRARPRLTSRLTVKRVLPSAAPTASAPGKISISRLNTRPACAPVNASHTPLRACPH